MPVIEKTLLNAQVLQITLNRPKQLNALTPTLLLALIAVMEEVNQSRSIRSVIISGKGRGFCAGADLKQSDDAGEVPGTEGMQTLGAVYKHQELLTRCILSIHECDKPVIAAVNGIAVGGGLAIALACDFRVASSDAKFAAAFIKTGLSSCDVGTSYFLPRLVSPTIALELMSSGRTFTAQEANSLGLLNKLASPDTLIEQAQLLADSFNENSEYGVWMTKKGFWSNLNAPSLRHAMELENRTQVLGYFTGCFEESMAAFAEGRKPTWKPL